ncbi:MAG: alpha/beta hydrolase [Candidatus Daviesbacteria bacterium]|nr:alpha/beta hydrolase [Candidatus Daviesbacteria bacterium]
MKSSNIKAIFIPGYHGAGEDILSAKHQMWFAWLKEELEKLGIEVIAKDYPDAYLCRANYWLPFIKKLGADENTILVGHSTGAIAAMRFAEENKILGSVLVGSYYTDLGDSEEKASGYFDNPWQWEKIKNNQKWIIQFHSTDDPWISNDEAHVVHEMLTSELHEFHNQGHFGADRPKMEFPELLEAIKQKLNII